MSGVPPCTSPLELTVNFSTYIFGKEFEMYSVLPSGENPIPFGIGRSLIAALSVPFAYRNTPLKGNSFAGSLFCFGRPNGGSVNQSEPSGANRRSFGLFRRLFSNFSRKGDAFKFLSRRAMRRAP